MILVFILIGMFIMSWIIDILSIKIDKRIGTREKELGQNRDMPEKRCPAHKWRERADGRLQCEWCRTVFGEWDQ